MAGQDSNRKPLESYPRSSALICGRLFNSKFWAWRCFCKQPLLRTL